MSYIGLFTGNYIDNNHRWKMLYLPKEMKTNILLENRITLYYHILYKVIFQLIDYKNSKDTRSILCKLNRMVAIQVFKTKYYVW